MNPTDYKPWQGFPHRHLLTLRDWSGDDIAYTLDVAAKLKAWQKTGTPHPLLAGKTLAMIFTKSSTRTRVSFEVGMHQLGGQPLFLSGLDIQLGRGETVADTARVLSRYVDGIMIRTFKQSDIEELAQYGSIPVINGLSDDYHPCQILADLMTIREHKGRLKGLKLAFIGDGNNVVHSLMLGCAKTGMDFAIACPAGYEPDPGIVTLARSAAANAGADIVITQDPDLAIRDADVVYSDVWASMGQEAQARERMVAFDGYQVNEARMVLAHKDAIFMHCLPAHRGEEVTAGVIDGPASVIFDEAENRLHAQKAVLALLLGQGQPLCRI